MSKIAAWFKGLSPTIMALGLPLLLGPALTSGIPRVMAPLFIAGCVLAVVADMFERRSWKIHFDMGLVLMLGAFVLYGLSSYFWSIDAGQSLKKIQQFLMVFLPLAAVVPVIARQSPARLEQLGKMAFVGLVLGLAVYLNERFNDFPFYNGLRGGETTDVIDTKQNKATILSALWLYIVFPFFVPRASWLRRGLFGLLFAGVAYITMTSQSASGEMILLATPLIGFVLFILRARHSLKLALAGIVFICVAMPSIALFVSNYTPWNSTHVINRSLKSRIEIWDQAARRTQERPWLGWGLNSAPKMPNRDEFSQLEYEVTHNIKQPLHHLHPHNAPLQIWFELGGVGIAIICGLMIFIFRRIGYLCNSTAQKYATFMWGMTFLYTLSIWGIWQTWFFATLCFMGLMAYVGARRLKY